MVAFTVHRVSTFHHCCFFKRVKEILQEQQKYLIHTFSRQKHTLKLRLDITDIPRNKWDSDVALNPQRSDGCCADQLHNKILLSI